MNELLVTLNNEIFDTLVRIHSLMGDYSSDVDSHDDKLKDMTSKLNDLRDIRLKLESIVETTGK